MTGKTTISRTRAALENVAFNYASIAVTIVQGVLLVPLYLKQIPLELYGAWLATGNVLAWIEMVDPGISTVLQQRVAFQAGRADRPALAQTVGTGLAITGVVSLLPLAFLPLASSLGGWARVAPSYERELATAFTMAVVALSLSLISYGLTAVNLGLHFTRAAGIGYLASLIVGVALTVGGLIKGLGLNAIAVGMLGRSGTGIVAAFVVMVRGLGQQGIRPAWASSEARQVLGATGFNFLSRAGSVLLGRFDAVLSTRLISPGATVVLTLTGRAVDIVRLATERIGASVMPAMAHYAGERGTASLADLSVRLGSAVTWIAAVLGGLVVAWNGVFVSLWVGQPQYGGLALTAAMVTAAGVAVYNGTGWQAVFAAGAIRRVSALSVVEGACKIAFQLGLIGLVGLQAFPAAGLLAAGLVSGLALPVIAARTFGSSPRMHFRAAARSLAVLLLFVAMGAGVSTLASLREAPWTWAQLIAGATGTALVLMTIPLVVDRDVRERAVAGWAFMRRMSRNANGAGT